MKQFFDQLDKGGLVEIIFVILFFYGIFMSLLLYLMYKSNKELSNRLNKK